MSDRYAGYNRLELDYPAVIAVALVARGARLGGHPSELVRHEQSDSTLIVHRGEERLDCEIRTVNGLPALLFQRPGAAEGFAPRWMFRVELDSRDQVSEAHAVLATRKLSALSFREIEDGSGRRRPRSRS